MPGRLVEAKNGKSQTDLRHQRNNRRHVDLNWSLQVPRTVAGASMPHPRHCTVRLLATACRVADGDPRGTNTPG